MALSNIHPDLILWQNKLPEIPLPTAKFINSTGYFRQDSYVLLAFSSFQALSLGEMVAALIES